MLMEPSLKIKRDDFELEFLSFPPTFDPFDLSI